MTAVETQGQVASVLARDQSASMVDELPGLLGIERVEHAQEALGAGSGADGAVGGDERLGEAGGYGAGLEADDNRLGVAEGDLDGAGAHDLVERGLGAAVADPATAAVVADRTHAGGDGAEDGALAARQKRAEMLKQQRGADGVDLHRARHDGRVEAADGLLGGVAVDGEGARGVEDEFDTAEGVAHVRGGGLDGRLVGELERRVRAPMQADDPTAAVVGGERVMDGGADTPVGADDDGAVVVGQ